MCLWQEEASRERNQETGRFCEYAGDIVKPYLSSIVQEYRNEDEYKRPKEKVVSITCSHGIGVIMM